MDRFLVWVLGTWHASLLLVAFIAGAHLAGSAGGLTAGLGTVAGLLAFAWLWLVSLWAAWRVLERTGQGTRPLAGEVGLHGAAAGAIFVAGLGTVALLTAFVQQGWDVGALIALPLVVIAAGFATAPGAVVAWILLGFDVLLVGGQRPEVSPASRQRP